MAIIKATVRRLRQPTFVPAPGQRIGNKNIMNRRYAILKIKNSLPQTKQVEVKKRWLSYKENKRHNVIRITLFLW